MKNAILILLSCCALSAFGQGRSQHHRPVVAQGPRPVTHAVVGGGIGTNAHPGAAVASPTMTYTGGVVAAPAYRVLDQRVRHRTPRHGRFRWEIVEERRCTPGYWVVERGCRRWVAPRNYWAVTRRVKQPCGPGHVHR